MDNGERIAKWILRNLRQAKNTHGYGLVLMNFTQQSIRNMEDSPKRAAAATELPVGFGNAVRDSGRPAPSMGVVLMEAPSAQAVTLVGSEACSSDNARTQTLPRQLTVDDYSAAA